jgi:hypothetical protein
MHQRRLVCLPVLLATLFGGCGGDDERSGGRASATPKGPPPAAQVQEAMTSILASCSEIRLELSSDTGPVSEQVDRMISYFKTYDADAQLAQSDLRADTMRQVLTQVREDIRTCSPADEDRINDTLTSSTPPADAEPAPTTEPVEETPVAGERRGVAAIAAELALLCVDKIGSPGPASPEIQALVDDLITAYETGPKNPATRNFMKVARDNLRDGCGRDQADKLQVAIDG